MKRLDLQWILIFLGVWLILVSSFTGLDVAMGLGLAVVSIFLVEQFFIKTAFGRHYPIDLVGLLIYGVGLIYEIYKAGVATIPIILTGKTNVRVVTIETGLKNDYYRSVLANSITLTPGTLTLDLDDNRLTVLWLNAIDGDEDLIASSIKGGLERRLQALEKRGL